MLKNSPFSKGEWPVETDIDVDFDGVHQAFDTPANAGQLAVTSKHLLASAYASGQHDKLLPMEPESFLQRWKSTIDARALVPDGGHDGRPPSTRRGLAQNHVRA